MNYKDMNISPDFIVLGIMWKAQQEDNNIHFSGIVKELDGVIPSNRVSSAHDRLESLGLISTKWIVKDKVGMNVFSVDDVGQKMAQEILDYMNKPKEEK